MFELKYYTACLNESQKLRLSRKDFLKLPRTAQDLRRRRRYISYRSRMVERGLEVKCRGRRWKIRGEPDLGGTQTMLGVDQGNNFGKSAS